MRYAWIVWVAALCAACSQPSGSTTPVPDAPAASLSPPAEGSELSFTRKPRPASFALASPDTRSQAQIDAAACTAADGSWRCTMAKPKAFGAPGSTPITPASWTVPLWFVDPANSSAAASDANTCTTSGAPCLSWGEIVVHRLGTVSPQLSQNTTFTYLSSQSVFNAANRVIFKGLTAAGAAVTFTGTPTTVCTGTLGTVTAKNRATPQLLKAVFTGCTGGTVLAQGEMVHNTTHPSDATIYTNVSGTTWNVSQPILTTGLINPQSTDSPTEVDGWTIGDTFTVTSNTNVDIGELSTRVFPDASGLANSVTVTKINVVDSAGVTGTNSLLLSGDGYVNFVNVNVQKATQLTSTGNTNSTAIAFGQGFYNCDFSGPVFGGQVVSPFGTQSPLFIGGQLRSSVAVSLLAGATLDADIIITSGGLYNQYTLGLVYVETGTVLGANNGMGRVLSLYNSTAGIVWGPGTLSVLHGGRMQYAGGAGAAAAAFKITTLQLDSQTKSCLAVPSAASSFGTCNKTLSAANLDTDLGGTSGCYSTGTSAFCNF